ncbi:MAG: hypothetical protein GY715_21040 [Planctomycetes bacterium]|nr:hypothetical protein [Planctomycetota bacterium]
MKITSAVVVVVVAGIVLAGCATTTVNPARATPPYPEHLHLDEVTVFASGPVRAPRAVDMQAFRDGQHIEIVNSTARSYRDFDLWINQRYMRHVKALPAGDTLRLHLGSFYDERGEQLNAGGFFATRTPTPVRLVQIQVDDTQSLIGLITIRAEDAEMPRPRR